MANTKKNFKGWESLPYRERGGPNDGFKGCAKSAPARNHFCARNISFSSVSEYPFISTGPTLRVTSKLANRFRTLGKFTAHGGRRPK